MGAIVRGRGFGAVGTAGALTAALLAATLTGCSTTVYPKAPAAAPPAATKAASTATAVPLTSPAATTVATATQAGPVSVLLAKYTGPITTVNMPKADESWIAAVEKTMDDGASIAKGGSGISVNLMALVDEAAKTSDLAALTRICSTAGTDPATLANAMQATDDKGQTGFAQLSFLLEHTHPAQGNTPSSSGDFPGFAAPSHGHVTSLDTSDMKQFGVKTAGAYKGIRTRFMNLNAGQHPYDGWMGLATGS